MIVTNTEVYGRHPEWLMGGNPSAIENQEREGIQELAKSGVLPVMLEEAKEHLESRGVIFGEIVKGDPIFQNVTLPEGWSKATTDHNMYVILLDENEEAVGSIFYKAAFYDRRASFTLA